MHLTHAQTRASPTIQTFTNNGNNGIVSHDFRISSILTQGEKIIRDEESMSELNR